MRKRAGDGRSRQCGCPLPSEEGKDCYLREEAMILTAVCVPCSLDRGVTVSVSVVVVILEWCMV